MAFASGRTIPIALCPNASHRRRVGGVICAEDTYRTTESGTLRKVNRNGIDGSIGMGRLVQLIGTPTANMSTTGRSEAFRKGRTPNPVEFAQMFPIPKARDFRSATGKEHRDSPDLNVVVKMLPTPRAFCHKDSTHDRGKGNLGEVIGGQLNPDWVEWLMGFPAGWTDISKDVPLPEYDPHWYDAEPDIPRTATGIPNRVDRLKALGNAVDPYQFYPVCECIAEVLRGGEA